MWTFEVFPRGACFPVTASFDRLPRIENGTDAPLHSLFNMRTSFLRSDIGKRHEPEIVALSACKTAAQRALFLHLSYTGDCPMADISSARKFFFAVDSISLMRLS